MTAEKGFGARPVTPTRDMSFEQISLMFSQMRQMVQLQKQNEQLHMTPTAHPETVGRSSEQMQQNPDWQTAPLFAPEIFAPASGTSTRGACKPTGEKERRRAPKNPFGSLPW